MGVNQKKILRLVLINAALIMISAGALLILTKGSPESGSTEPERSRRIVVTVDDLPAVRGDYATMFDVTSKLINIFKVYDIPAVGFVNEVKLYWTGNPEPYIKLLQMWIDAGLEIGNHSYSHFDPNNTSLEEYTQDIIKGEKVTKSLLRRAGSDIVWYRHPFLHTGPTPEYEKKLNRFLVEHGYRVAPVTLQNRDWVYAAVYREALKNKDQRQMQKIVDAYVEYMREITIFWEDMSEKHFGYEIPQVALFHASQLNAGHFDKAARMFKERGYEFVTLNEALKDEAYAQELGFSEQGMSWLFRWMLAKNVKLPEEPKEQEFIQDLYRKINEKIPEKY